MSYKRAILALIATAAILGGMNVFGPTAGATSHPAYPHPECEDDTYGNQYCDTTTAVKCPPKSTTTTVVTTTEAPTTTVSQSTTTIPEPTTTTVERPEIGTAVTISREVVVNPPEFHHDHPNVPSGVKPLSFTG